MKQWYSPTIGHNSRATTRPYGTFPPGYVTPAIETPNLVDSMPGVGAEKFCAAIYAYLGKSISINEMQARISVR